MVRMLYHVSPLFLTTLPWDQYYPYLHFGKQSLDTLTDLPKVMI